MNSSSSLRDSDLPPAPSKEPRACLMAASTVHRLYELMLTGGPLAGQSKTLKAINGFPPDVYYPSEAERALAPGGRRGAYRLMPGTKVMCWN